MLGKLFLLFTIVPLIDLLVLIPLGQEIGLIPTILLVVVTAMVGSWLGAREGRQAWKRIREDLANARLPGDSVLDGLAVAMACALLVTPGVITDAFGLILLIPASRGPIKRFARSKFTNMLQNPDVTVIDLNQRATRWQNDDVIDITPESSENPRGTLDAH